MASSLLTELWRLKLSDMTSEFDDVISPSKISALLWNFVDFFNLVIPIILTIASFHKLDCDLQEYRHLQMSFTYDVIDVSLRRTINDMVLKIL